MRSRPEIVGTFGVAASTHWQASAAAMAMLEKGGNAFDAAVAAGTVLHIVEPDQNGPGGEVPLLLWSARKGKAEAICGQGTAPAAADAARLAAMGFEIMPGTGHLPAVVPGSFGTWMLLLRDYGSLTVREVLAPAIAIARQGFLATPVVAGLLAGGRDFMVRHWPSSAAAYLPGGAAPEAGSLYRLPQQAASFERLCREAEAAGGDRQEQAEAARRAWYCGFVAEAIDRFMRQPVMDSSGEAHAGLMTGDDLAAWQPAVEEPLTLDWDGWTVCKAGPWAQSPVFLQQLALLRGFDLAAMDAGGPDFIHSVQECAKLAFADREAFYGDPRFVEVPLRRLLSEDYNRARRRLVGERARADLPPGRIAGAGGAIALRRWGSTAIACPEMGGGVAGAAGRPGGHEGDTCHFDIADRWGNMISGTPSGGWLSGAPAVPGLGFPVSVRGQMFSLDEGHPNCIRPGKRPRTTLTPGLALQDGEPRLAFGTPGGDHQDQWALHAFLRHAVFGMGLQEALDAPSFHSDHAPSSFFPREWRPRHLAIEDHIPAATLEELARRGHQLEVAPRWSHYNSMTMVWRRGGVLRAAASPRRQCYAVGR